MYENFGHGWNVRPVFSKPIRRRKRLKEIYTGGRHLLLSHIKKDIRRYGQVSYPVVGLDNKFELS